VQFAIIARGYSSYVCEIYASGGSFALLSLKSLEVSTQHQNRITGRAKMEGFFVFTIFDYVKYFPSCYAAGLADGSIKRKFHVVEGFRKAPIVLPMLFTEGNTGKLYVTS
jgi:NADPH-dependent curcumin reductase CurA